MDESFKSRRMWKLRIDFFVEGINIFLECTEADGYPIQDLKDLVEGRDFWLLPFFLCKLDYWLPRYG